MSKEKLVKELLEKSFWLDGIDPNEIYQISDDDAQGNLTVIFGNDGDAHIKTNTDPVYASVRLRTFAGGGRNHRSRIAVMILALAIKLDNEEHGLELLQESGVDK